MLQSKQKRYSSEELQVFEAFIIKKLAKAKNELRGYSRLAGWKKGK